MIFFQNQILENLNFIINKKKKNQLSIVSPTIGLYNPAFFSILLKLVSDAWYFD